MSELTDETGDLPEARPDLYRDIGYGLVERDVENIWLAAGVEPSPLDDLIGHSITYRIAVRPRAGVSVSGTTAVADGARRFAGQGRLTPGSRSP